jgi:hypothetical protein
MITSNDVLRSPIDGSATPPAKSKLWPATSPRPPLAPAPTRGRRLEKLRGTPVELEMRPLSLPPRRPRRPRTDTKRWGLSVKMTASRIGKTRQGARFAREV